MAPIMMPGRKRPRESLNLQIDEQQRISYTWTVIAVSTTVLLLAVSSWALRWTTSGCAIESLIFFYGASTGKRVFPAIPLWTLLTTLNLAYAIASTSWLLFAVFTLLCWPAIFLTCLFQFEFVADFARRNLRRILKDVQFTRDTIALFNLPALEIDTEVSGLLVVRGVTISLSSLTIIAHGVEVGIKLTDDIELALHADEVTIPLLRKIEIGDVYGNIKGGKAEMTFAEVEEDDTIEDDFFTDTPLLRAATAGSAGIKRRPALRESSLTGGSFILDSSPSAGFKSIRTLSPDDQAAEEQYLNMLTEIRTTSAVYQSRARVRQAAKEKGLDYSDEKDMRAAVCAELHDFPSVPHPPQRSIKITTLRDMTSLRMKRFQHRLPFLLRLLLAPIGYFHPVTFRSINAAGSGQWAKEILQTYMFKTHGENSAEVRRLQRRMATWLADANFCLQLTDIDGVGQIPLSTNFDIVAYLHFADIIAYRTLPESGILTQVVRLGGADATFTIPSFLLPHHEHILPPRPTPEHEHEVEAEIREADGIPKIVKAEQQLNRVQKDETAIKMSVHASLPAAFDQSLLTFIAALVKASKIIEFDREVEKINPETGTDSEPATPKSTEPLNLSRASTIDSLDNDTAIPAKHKRVQSDLTGTASHSSSRFKNFTKTLQQNLKEASLNTAGNVSKESIREFVKDIHQSTRDGMKKTLVGSMVNDRWIAKMVGKIAINLEQIQGDVGYSGEIAIPLELYRPKPGDDGMLSKILP